MTASPNGEAVFLFVAWHGGLAGPLRGTAQRALARGRSRAGAWSGAESCPGAHWENAGSRRGLFGQFMPCVATGKSAPLDASVYRCGCPGCGGNAPGRERERPCGRAALGTGKALRAERPPRKRANPQNRKALRQDGNPAGVLYFCFRRDALPQGERDQNRSFFLRSRTTEPVQPSRARTLQTRIMLSSLVLGEVVSAGALGAAAGGVPTALSHSSHL